MKKLLLLLISVFLLNVPNVLSEFVIICVTPVIYCIYRNAPHFLQGDMISMGQI